MSNCSLIFILFEVPALRMNSPRNSLPAVHREGEHQHAEKTQYAGSSASYISFYSLILLDAPTGAERTFSRAMRLLASDFA